MRVGHRLGALTGGLEKSIRLPGDCMLVARKAKLGGLVFRV